MSRKSYPEPVMAGWCTDHGKALWCTRKMAKKKVREQAIAKNGPRMREYRCDAVDGHWHIGHLPDEVKHGLFTAREMFG